MDTGFTSDRHTDCSFMCIKLGRSHFGAHLLLDMAALHHQVVAARVEDFLGLLPCLAWRAVCRRPLTEATMKKIAQCLSECGCHIPATAPLGAGSWIRLLAMVVLGPLLRLDNPAIKGSQWDMLLAPQMEVRVIVRYMRQNPQRTWSPAKLATPITAQDISGRLPADIATLALPILQQHAKKIFHRRTNRVHLHDNGYYVEAFRLEVDSLWCVLMGFELIIRCTLARPVSCSESDHDSQSLSDC